MLQVRSCRLALPSKKPYARLADKVWNVPGAQKSIAIEDKETRPPKRLTEANLLTAMETAGESLDDKELSRAMKRDVPSAVDLEALHAARREQRRALRAPQRRALGLVGLVLDSRRHHPRAQRQPPLLEPRPLVVRVARPGRLQSPPGACARAKVAAPLLEPPTRSTRCPFVLTTSTDQRPFRFGTVPISVHDWPPLFVWK